MKTILVVDDEEHILNLVELSLTPDFQVLKAKNCKETFENINKQKPDMVLLDVMLPHVSGFEICKKCCDHYPAGTNGGFFPKGRSRRERLL